MAHVSYLVDENIDIMRLNLLLILCKFTFSVDIYVYTHVIATWTTCKCNNELYLDAKLISIMKIAAKFQ